jgi:ABC-type Fe3+ transport system permease subunit
MSYGLLRAKGWAWTITIILVIIGIGIQVLSAVTGPVFNASFVRTSDVDATNSLISGIVGSVIGIAISILILYYLYRPNVKSYFGKMQ